MASQKMVSRESNRLMTRTPQRCSACPELDDSKQSWIGVNLDIEERKLADFYLTEGQRLAHMGSWAFNPDGFYYWSPELFRMHGLDPASKPPGIQEYLDHVHPHDRESMPDVIRGILANASPFDATKRIFRPNGEVRYIRFVGAPVFENQGLRKYVGSAIDVTEHELLTQELRRREAYLAELQKLSHAGSWAWNPATGEPGYWSEECYRVLGFDPAEPLPLLEAIFQRIQPDDARAAIREQFDRGIRDKADFELEMSFVHPTRGIRNIRSTGRAVVDTRGDLVEIVGTVIDITERKRAEEAIRRSEAYRKQAEDTLRRENVDLREEIDEASMFEEIVGTSPALKTVLSHISKVAQSDSTVLISGETGTGKELVARAIHRKSGRTLRPFVSVNCAVIPRDLVASELFGHEKGAFTGASRQRLGRFELANGGTIFLDEVGELPIETQIALLRVLQEREFERVGGTRRIHVDVRIIAATNRDLQAAITDGSFRRDLFYRLHVFPIQTPALRERREDIPLLVEYFIDHYARKAGKNITSVDKTTLQVLQSYAWPGNIRELQNIIERSVILSDSEALSVQESWFPENLMLLEPKNVRELNAIQRRTKSMIEAALRESRGRVFGPSGAAAKLGIPRSTLESKIRSLKIDKNRFRSRFQI
jgi:PAS domain S-box-containing protein